MMAWYRSLIGSDHFGLAGRGLTTGRAVIVAIPVCSAFGVLVLRLVLGSLGGTPGLVIRMLALPFYDEVVSKRAIV